MYLLLGVHGRMIQDMFSPTFPISGPDQQGTCAAPSRALPQHKHFPERVDFLARQCFGPRSSRAGSLGSAPMRRVLAAGKFGNSCLGAVQGRLIIRWVVRPCVWLSRTLLLYYSVHPISGTYVLYRGRILTTRESLKSGLFCRELLYRSEQSRPEPSEAATICKVIR